MARRRSEATRAGTPGARSASSPSCAASQRYATAPAARADSRNAGLKAAPLQTKRSPGWTERESQEAPVTETASAGDGGRKRPGGLERPRDVCERNSLHTS